MAVFEHLQAIAIEVDVAVKVHLMERLHGDLVLAMVLGLVGGLLEGEVVLDRAAGELGLLRLARRDSRHNQPETAEEGGAREDGKEDCKLETVAELPGHVQRDTAEDGDQEFEREGVVASAIGRQGGILDRGVLFFGIG
jgi:hypothetical protein